MNELTAYALISVVSMGLFYFWYKRQGLSAEKKWLVDKISQSRGDETQIYSDSLNQLSEQKSNKFIYLVIALMLIPTAFLINSLWFQSIPIADRFSLANNNSDNSINNNAPDLATAIKQLEKKLADDPNDLEGQLLYARSMMQLQNYEVAVGAYQQANQVDPNNPDILVNLAEAIAFKNNTGSFLGEPELYLDQAIKLQPLNQKGMWLKGIVLYEQEKFVDAETIWTDLLPMVSNPNIKSTITKQINQARLALNKDLLSEPVTNEINQPEYFIVIDASDAIKQINLGPNARLFVYAKQVDSNGQVTMPMPIAAIPIPQPLTWPMSMTMNDQHNLNPNRKLSSFEQIQFSAKLSPSGSATPTNDDIKSSPVIADRSQQSIQLTITQ